jgi:hypothetical protein
MAAIANVVSRNAQSDRGSDRDKTRID